MRDIIGSNNENIMIGSLKLGNDNQNFNMREVNIEDENENLDLEINRKAHLIASIYDVDKN